MTLLIAYGLNIIDYLFTRHWVNLYGIDIEGNPFGRWLFENNFAGVFKIFVVPIFLAILWACIQKFPQAKWVQFIPVAVYFLIGLYHMGLLIYTNLL